MLGEYPDISRSDIVRSEHFQVDYISRPGRSPVGHFPVGTFPGRDTSRSEHFLFPVGTLPGRPESVLQKISTFAKRQFKRQRNIHFEHNYKRRLQWVGLGAWENPRGSLEHPRNYLMSARLGSVRLGQVRLGCCDFPGEIHGESLKRPRNSLMLIYFWQCTVLHVYSIIQARFFQVRLGQIRLQRLPEGIHGESPERPRYCLIFIYFWWWALLHVFSVIQARFCQVKLGQIRLPWLPWGNPRESVELPRNCLIFIYFQQWTVLHVRSVVQVRLCQVRLGCGGILCEGHLGQICEEPLDAKDIQVRGAKHRWVGSTFRLEV